MTRITVALLMAAMLSASCVRPPSPTIAPLPAATQTAVGEPAQAPPVTREPSTIPQPQQGAASTTATLVPRQKETADTIPLSSLEIARRAAEVFGDSTIAAPTVAAAATSAHPATSGMTIDGDEPSWDIDVRSYESTARVAHYVQLFTGRAKDGIAARLERGTRYEAMIRGKMRDGGLPEDMYYLALIESGFDPNAYSRAAAVGMWQFMTSTARDMGLRVDWWVDERRDPVKSTTAAVRFIKGLKEQFGSLYLAAAAYNGGPGRVARGLTRYAGDLEGTTGDDLFFALAKKDYLRTETREYVPQLIAAALIAKEPKRYGMPLTPRSPLVYDSVRVGPATPLAAIAHASNVVVSDLIELNPFVLRGITPPKDSFFVRVPPGAADSFAVAFANLPGSERVGLRTMTAKKGESFATIARREGLAAHQLSVYNPKVKALKSGNLAVGQSVLVPTPAVAAAAVLVPDPSIERYTGSATMHVVKSGETLGGIAKQYHTTTSALMHANGLRRALIFPGQSLVLGRQASDGRNSKAALAKSAGTKKIAKAKSSS